MTFFKASDVGEGMGRKLMFVKCHCLSCELVLNYKLSFPDILVVTDCDDYEPRILVERDEDPPWRHILILIPCVFILCLAAYVKRQLALSKPELLTDTMFPMTSKTL